MIPTPTEAEKAELHALEMKAMQAAAESQMANGRACYHTSPADITLADNHYRAMMATQYLLPALAHQETEEAVRKALRPESPAWPVHMCDGVHVDDDIALLIAEMLRPGRIKLCKVRVATPPDKPEKVMLCAFTSEEPPLDFLTKLEGAEVRVVRPYY